MTKAPCKSCPWRRGSDDNDIPGFSRELAQSLRQTCDKESFKAMACHGSSMSRPSICQGFAQSDDALAHIGLRLATRAGYAQGFQPAREDCFRNYDEMAAHHGWFKDEEP
jgi:hypothetical protein